MDPAREVGALVLGAGLQGVGIALELAERGIASTLIDQDEQPLNRAGLRNEGKIHLGIIYANDRSRGTAFLQLDGALCFARVLNRWMRGDSAWLAKSTPFHYLVSTDSIVTPDALAEHYAAVQEQCRARLAEQPELDYLGERPASLVTRLPVESLALHFDAGRFIGAFETAEHAIDTEVMAVALRRRVLQEPLVTFMPSHAVRAITRTGDRFRVEGDAPNGPWSLGALQVVNAMWEQRLRFDQQLGIAPVGDALHRLKYRVIARLPQQLRGAPSVTMVLGRFGDVVVRPNGTVYLSWYPSGLRGWSHDIQPPDDWGPACRGEVPAPFARQLADEVLSAIDAWYPGIGECVTLRVDAGVIVAIGRSDVDDAASALHDRSQIGVTTRGGYHSVDPGKLTTAPLFALQTADRIEDVRHAMGGR